MKYLWKSFQCGIPQGHHYFHHFPHLFQWLDLHYTRFHMFSFSNGSNAKINCYPIMPFMFHSHFSSTNAVFKTWLYFHFCGMISSFTYQFLSVVTIVYHWDTETNNIIMSEHEQNNKCTVTNINTLWEKWHDWILIIITCYYTVICGSQSWQWRLHFIQLLKVNTPCYLELEFLLQTST